MTGDDIDPRRLRLALEVNGIGFWERDLRTGKAVRTHVIDEIFGFKPGEVGDDAAPFLARIHPEDRVMMQRTIEEAGDPPPIREFRITRTDGAVRWIMGRAEYVRDADGRPVRVVSVLRDVTEQRKADLALRESEARFRALADSVPALVWMSGLDNEGVYFNRPWVEFTGRPLADQLGDGWLAFVHPDDLPALDACKAAFAARRPFRTEFRLRRHDGAWRWMLDSGVPRFGDEGAFLGFIGSCVDITERRDAEERLKLLAAEVDHRAKNLLAVVLSLLRITRADSVRDYAAAVQGRIAALARAHTLLSASRWEGAALRRLAEEELAPHRGEPGRVVIDGPDLLLAPAAAQAVAMALHELATNAAKHGALSAPQGRVEVRWRAREDALIDLTWTEYGGLPARPPARRGVGSAVIERIVARQLGGGVAYDWRAEGLRCRLTLPTRDGAAD